MQVVPLNLYKCVCGPCPSQDFRFLWLIVGITNNWNSDAKNWNTRKATSSMLWLCMKVTQLFCQCLFDASKTSVSKIAMPKNWNSVIVFSPLFVFPKRGALEPSQNLLTVSPKTAVPQRKVSQFHHSCRANSYPRRSTPSSCRSREPIQRNRTLIFGSFLDEPLLVVRLWVCWACPKADSNRLEILNVSVSGCILYHSATSKITKHLPPPPPSSYS